jgi:hypothetical protein
MNRLALSVGLLSFIGSLEGMEMIGEFACCRNKKSFKHEPENVAFVTDEKYGGRILEDLNFSGKAPVASSGHYFNSKYYLVPFKNKLRPLCLRKNDGGSVTGYYTKFAIVRYENDKIVYMRPAVPGEYHLHIPYFLKKSDITKNIVCRHKEVSNAPETIAIPTFVGGKNNGYRRKNGEKRGCYSENRYKKNVSKKLIKKLNFSKIIPLPNNDGWISYLVFFKKKWRPFCLEKNGNGNVIGYHSSAAILFYKSNVVYMRPATPGEYYFSLQQAQI